MATFIGLIMNSKCQQTLINTLKKRRYSRRFFTELLQPFNDYNSLLLRIIKLTDPNFSYNCIEAEILAARFFRYFK